MAVDCSNWTTRGRLRRRLRQGHPLVVREAGAVPAGRRADAGRTAGRRPPSTSTSTTGAPASTRISRSTGTRPTIWNRQRGRRRNRRTRSRSSARPTTPTSRSRTAARRPPTNVVVKGFHCKPSAGRAVAERPAADDHAGDRRPERSPANNTAGEDRRAVRVDAEPERLGPRLHADDRRRPTATRATSTTSPPAR